jgi:hypothetical protein
MPWCVWRGTPRRGGGLRKVKQMTILILMDVPAVIERGSDHVHG